MNARILLTHALAAALAFALGYGLANGRLPGLGAAARSDDAVSAFLDAVKLEDTHARTRALLDFFATADPELATRLRSEVNQPSSTLILDEIGEALFASWWAKSDPAAAAAGVVDPAWANRHPWIREVMLAWVRRDAMKAAEAAGQLPPNPDRGRLEATRVLVEHWWDQPASTDYPAPLFALIHQLEVVPRAGAVQRLIESSIQKRGIDVTEQFVESIPKDDENIGVSVQQEIFARFGQTLLDHDTARAVAWANKHGAGREGSGILRHLAFAWGNKDGPAAMEWAMGLPDTMDRPNTLFRVWLSFRQTKPEEAVQWLLAHEPNEVLLGVYQRYLTGTAGMDPKQAIEIAERAQDPAIRNRLLSAVGRGWMVSDREAAEKWLDSVDLGAELEAEVRKSAATPGPIQAEGGASPSDAG